MAASVPNVSPPKPSSEGRHAFMVWAVVIGLCLAALFTTYLLFVEAPPPKKVVIATGGKTGAYYQFGQRYAAELAKEGLTVEVRETKGSVENLQLLLDENSDVDVAIIQSGVADVGERERLDSLGSLYREPLWVFYRGEPALERLSQLAGKRIGIGPPGSGTYAVARALLAANGITDSKGSKTALSQEPVAAAAKALQKGELDAALFVAALEADYVKDLLKDDSVRLLSFVQHEAYHRRFRFLSQVTLPAGLVNLGENVPDKEVHLVAPTAMLVVRKGFHPALVPLFLSTATRLHGKGDELSSPGEFPTTAYTDFPVSEDARHYYRAGPPVLQRLLPFWLASLVDRLKVMLIPLVVLLMPLFRVAPPLARWRTRRKIYRWYAALREVDRKLLAGLSGSELDGEIARMRDIESAISLVNVPLSYSEELYHLRMHVTMMQEKLVNLRGRTAD
jgi:TRAP transporter TAXI family solute receptor